MTDHQCPGSLFIADQTIAQCGDCADTAAAVLLFAALIAGLKAGRHPGDLAAELTELTLAAEALTGIKARAAQ
ncbi:hypothetical protein [Paracoccus alkanivorans]|uniref:Uncharacterized protein n=1 Tax=Paracoccus alkanivorans TaxID=2116655 RepID=A0A3M0MKD0_9RHOB|nr:hypothetical protein [Paracoccus alkanivorans]RMC37523.1 hypothetical protein C9E81_01865 [Paracoccus alkanivorans]